MLSKPGKKQEEHLTHHYNRFERLLHWRELRWLSVRFACRRPGSVSSTPWPPTPPEVTCMTLNTAKYDPQTSQNKIENKEYSCNQPDIVTCSLPSW